MNGHAFNYKTGIKGNWRRTVWNRIVERLVVPAKDAVVLYLAGPEDLDRPVALNHGFRKDNLIAIDRENSVVKSLKSKGALCCKADLNNALNNWGTSEIHVVLADFCCGYVQSVLEFSVIMSCAPCVENAVIMVNLMRGRELWRDNKKEWAEAINGKHRARLVYEAQMSGREFWEHFPDTEYVKRTFDPETLAKYADEWPRAAMAKAWDNFVSDETHQPWFSSYNSQSGQVFDSGVWLNLSNERFWRYGTGKPTGMAFISPKGPVARSLTAIRATRTRRLNGFGF